MSGWVMSKNMGRRDVNAAQRAILALKLRSQRLTYSEIASRCGYGSAQAAQRAIARELDRCIVAQVDILRREEQAMLDQLHAKVWQRAIGEEDGRPDLAAVDRILKIAEARRALFGLNAKANEGIPPAEVIIRQYDATIEGV
jgi:hypothetical protein